MNCTGLNVLANRPIHRLLPLDPPKPLKSACHDAQLKAIAFPGNLDDRPRDRTFNTLAQFFDHVVALPARRLELSF